MAAATNGPTTGVVVTGGGSGIGLATARALAEVGRPVALWQRRDAADQAKAITDDYGVAAVSQQVDVADRAAVFAAAEEAEQSLGPIGGLVVNGAIFRAGAVGMQKLQDWDDTLAVNLSGSLHCAEAILPALRRSGAGASIVFVSSTEGYQGFSIVPAYCASKHGMIGLMRSMSWSLGPEGIRVNAVCPGATDTSMWDFSLEELVKSVPPELQVDKDTAAQMIVSRTALRRMAQPEEMAGPIRFLLSDDASYMTGAVVPVDAGMTAGTG